jgi:hypothetical protein
MRLASPRRGHECSDGDAEALSTACASRIGLRPHALRMIGRDMLPTGGNPRFGDERDREMRCGTCGLRCFTANATTLVSSGARCPSCAGRLMLIPGQGEQHTYAYPRVTEVARNGVAAPGSS